MIKWKKVNSKIKDEASAQMWSTIHLKSLHFKEKVMKLKTVSVTHACIRSLWEMGTAGLLLRPILVSLRGEGCFSHFSRRANSRKRKPQSTVNKCIDWRGTAAAFSSANFTITLPLQDLLPFFPPNSIHDLLFRSHLTDNNLLLHTICLNIYIHIHIRTCHVKWQRFLFPE